MPGGGHENQEEVVISGDAVVKRCPAQLQRRGDIQEPEYGRMQVRALYCSDSGGWNLVGTSSVDILIQTGSSWRKKEFWTVLENFPAGCSGSPCSYSVVDFTSIVVSY